HASARAARRLLPALVRRSRASVGQAASGWLRLHLPARKRPALPRPGGPRRADARLGLRGRRVPAARRRDRRAPHRDGSMTAIAAPGLDLYLAELEDRLERAVGSHAGIVAEVGAEAISAGGKRLRPLLVFLSSPPGTAPPLAAGVAVELVHMATLVHDDLIDGARMRRGHASAWSAHGPDAAKAAGDYLFARAFAELAATGDSHAVAILANATLCLARGEAMQRSQRFDPDTSIDAYLERCTLKTAKLFEAACRLASG